MLHLSHHAGLLATTSNGLVQTLIFIVPMVAIFYFLLWRPQQQRAKVHREMVANLRRGDVVITRGGLIGKIVRVAEAEATIELADNVRIKILKAFVEEVRAKTEPAPANDTGDDSGEDKKKAKSKAEAEAEDEEPDED